MNFQSIEFRKVSCEFVAENSLLQWMIKKAKRTNVTLHGILWNKVNARTRHARTIEQKNMLLAR